MTFGITTSLDALRVQRALDSNQSVLTRTLQRLSSGLRVNQAADDAAGLAVATRLEALQRGAQQSLRNSNDAISMVQTADAQLGHLGTLLLRARELATQASNSIYSVPDRAAMDRELQQTLAEFDRLATTSHLNGRKLLNGSLQNTALQIGANAGDRLQLDWNIDMRRSAQGALEMTTSADLRTSGGFPFAGTYTSVALGNMDFSIPASPFRGGAITTAGTPVFDYTGGEAASFTVDGVLVNLTGNYGSLAGVANAVQSRLSAARSGWYTVTQDGSSLTITKTGSAGNPTTAVNVVAVSGANADAFAAGTPSDGAAAVTATWAGFQVDGHAVFLNGNYTGNDGGLIGDIQAQLDAIPAIAGKYTVGGSAAGISIAKLDSLAPPSIGNFTGTGARFAQAPPATLTLATGDFQIKVGNNPAVNITGRFTTPDQLASAVNAKGLGVYAAVDTTTGTLKLLSTRAFSVLGGQADPGGALGFGAADSLSDGHLGQVNLLSASSAGEVIMRVDATLNTLTQTRARLGAHLSRLDAVVAGLQNSSTQMAATRSRIMDADYAQEMSQLVKRQILRQVGLAMVAQANQQQRHLVLALLR